MSKRKKKLQLKDIIPYLAWTDNVAIEVGDTIIGSRGRANDEWEEVFRGAAMDIPWYLMNYYLKNTKEWEAIGICTENGKSYLSISVVENKKNA